MATNRYFEQGTRSEQRLYEDLVIESLKIYGQDVYYLPREIVRKDTIFGDDSTSRFDDAYRIEMYIENIEGFDGEGDLFTKFGVEIRDGATFIVARRRWNDLVALYKNKENQPFHRPREGDLIFLPLSNSFFEITRTETEQPFYQLKDLPVFKMRCELFEYNDEDFDTGVAIVDNIEANQAYQSVLVFSSNVNFVVGDEITQIHDNYTMKGEIVKIDAFDPTNYTVYVAHSGGTDGLFHEWSTQRYVSNEIGIKATPKSVGEDLQEGIAQTDAFDDEASKILVFDESNPFGDPI